MKPGEEDNGGIDIQEEPSRVGLSPWVVFLQTLFVTTGLGRTFSNQQVVNLQGSLDVMLFLSFLSALSPTIVSLALVGPTLFRISRRTVNICLITAGYDVLGMLCTLMALKWAGSGLTMVVYSSLPAMAAALRWLVLGKGISRRRVVFMFGVMGGLSLVPLHEGLNFDASSSVVLMGMAASFASTGLYALLYCHVEAALSDGDAESQSPLVLMFWQAIFSCGFLLIMYLGVALLGQEPSSVKGLVANPEILWPLIAIVVSSAGHSYAWICLIELRGSTATGLLQAVRSSANLVLSAVLFCDIQAVQCLTWVKIVSGAIVIFNLTMFNNSM